MSAIIFARPSALRKPLPPGILRMPAASPLRCRLGPQVAVTGRTAA